MSENTQREVILNPGRREVYDIIVTAVNNSEGDPGQTFADALSAAVVIGHMAQVDLRSVPDLISKLDEVAQKAAELLMAEITKTEESDG